jgi:DNA-binding sugar fermentation-stimulating protein
MNSINIQQEAMNKHLFTLPQLYRSKVIKRPSATCKSPYVADVQLIIDGVEIFTMAHAPALGCDGLCDKGATVLISKLEKKSKTSVCEYRIELAETKEKIIVGVNPKLAEKIVEEGIMKSEITKSYKREKTILNSRFDFVGCGSDDRNFVLEVKTVPLLVEPKVAFFPHGYRKKKGDAVSPRALKHLDDLIQISKESDARAMMCYVIQRGDANSFVPSETDPIYKAKFYEAREEGVIMKNLYVEWNDKGECFMRDYRDYLEVK